MPGKLPPIYIPICLYTRFFSRTTNMKYLFSQYVETSEKSLILVCDTLHAYNLLARAECRDWDEAEKKARRHGENLIRMIQNVAKSFPDAIYWLGAWHVIADQQGFKAIREQLGQALTRNEDLRNMVDTFSSLFLKKLRIFTVAETNISWEREYLVSEITMSVYVTEVLGYSRELWEEPPDPKFPDPIGYLYEQRPDLVKAWVGSTSLKRHLEVLRFPHASPYNVRHGVQGN